MIDLTKLEEIHVLDFSELFFLSNYNSIRFNKYSYLINNSRAD